MKELEMEELIKAALALKGRHLFGCRAQEFNLGPARKCSCKIGKVVAIAEALSAQRLANRRQLPLE